MKTLRFLLSLITEDNDYQRLQASAAEEAAQNLDVELDIVYADNDGILQSQQLLEFIQSRTSRLDAIVFEPAGTALASVARAAAEAGIGWVALNKQADYFSELRKAHQVLMFSISSDNRDVGRIQGEQLGVLLPRGGVALYVQGPNGNSAAEQRTLGMMECKPGNIEVRMVRGDWTEDGGYKAICSWLRLPTSHEMPIGVLASQNDAMAKGALKAFQEQAPAKVRSRLVGVPCIGCDGVPATRQAWVRSGLLAATVVMPPNAGLAVEMAVQAIRTGTLPSEHTTLAPESYPSLNELARRWRSAI
jgi:ABC-type sugar transport system substrate-binding protein